MIPFAVINIFLSYFNKRCFFQKALLQNNWAETKDLLTSKKFTMISRIWSIKILNITKCFMLGIRVFLNIFMIFIFHNCWTNNMQTFSTNQWQKCSYMMTSMTTMWSLFTLGELPWYNREHKLTHVPLHSNFFHSLSLLTKNH